MNSPITRRRFKNFRAGGVWIGENLFTFTPGSLMAPRPHPPLNSAWVLRNWPRYAIPGLAATLSANGFDTVDLVYNETPVHSWDMPNAKKVYRLADNPAGFRTHTAARQAMLVKQLGEADICLCSAKSLVGLANALSPGTRVEYFPNGIDLEHFRAKPPDHDVYPKARGRTVIVYSGMLEEWFAWDWLERAAREYPDCYFAIIGPLRGKARLNLPNVDFLGPIEYKQMPAYLSGADVGIIPFDNAAHHDLVDSINPLKLYEYMASGLAVAAVHTTTLAEIGSPALLARAADEFCEQIGNALANREALARSGQQFASGCGWREKVDHFLRLTGFVK